MLLFQFSHTHNINPKRKEESSERQRLGCQPRVQHSNKRNTRGGGSPFKMMMRLKTTDAHLTQLWPGWTTSSVVNNLTRLLEQCPLCVLKAVPGASLPSLSVNCRPASTSLACAITGGSSVRGAQCDITQGTNASLLPLPSE